MPKGVLLVAVAAQLGCILDRALLPAGSWKPSIVSMNAAETDEMEIKLPSGMTWWKIASVASISGVF